MEKMSLCGTAVVGVTLGIGLANVRLYSCLRTHYHTNLYET